MTTKTIENRIQDIKDQASNPEAAHVAEDRLYLDFINDVASSTDSSPELRKKAKLVASSDEIRFSRWYA